MYQIGALVFGTDQPRGRFSSETIIGINTAATTDPDPRGGGQLPNPNECNSTLTSATWRETLYGGCKLQVAGRRLQDVGRGLQDADAGYGSFMHLGKVKEDKKLRVF